MIKSFQQVTVLNINGLKFPSPQRFETVLLDTIDTCNLHCLYCHNPRTKQKISLEDLEQFLTTQIKSVINFQIGCAMEPTMDRRLGQIVKMIKASPAAPSHGFRIQTNGTLLHKHNLEEIQEGGVNLFTVSLDTLNSKIHAELRGGSNIDIILNNIKLLRTKIAKVEVWLVVTTTSKNINDLEEIVQYGIDNGIRTIEFRNMFHYADSSVIADHDKMRKLTVPNYVFLQKTLTLCSKYKHQMDFIVNDRNKLEGIVKNTDFSIK